MGDPEKRTTHARRSPRIAYTTEAGLFLKGTQRKGRRLKMPRTHDSASAGFEVKKQVLLGGRSLESTTQLQWTHLD